jgi:hypothetical protein
MVVELGCMSELLLLKGRENGSTTPDVERRGRGPLDGGSSTGVTSDCMYRRQNVCR